MTEKTDIAAEHSAADGNPDEMTVPGRSFFRDECRQIWDESQDLRNRYRDDFNAYHSHEVSVELDGQFASQCRNSWNDSVDIRSEYRGDFNAYLATCRANQRVSAES